MEEENKKKGSAKKVLLIILLSLLALLVAVVAAGLIFINSFLNKLDRNEITGDPSLREEEVYEEETVDATDSAEHIDEAQKEFEDVQQIDPLKNANIKNVLLIGSDRRSTGENGRSDSMILVTMNFDTGKVHLTSLMRAMYVNIPRSDGDVWGMLNAAYSWGGPKLLIDTIENNFRVHIDHYVVVDFASFELAVNLLGGVELTLSEEEAFVVSGWSRIPTPSGTTQLNGKQALVYARIRYIDNDFVRTSRQRNVVEALMKKAIGSDLATLMSLADQILPYVNTNLNNVEIIYYLSKAPGLLKNPITQRMLPIENEAGKTYTGKIYVNGREMYKVDFETNIKALHDFMLS
ncbi:MAG: LCP family protein [Oscillospiraceae bacterium]|nr:LCP family protein [Oscillospiraceae bacterium]